MTVRILSCEAPWRYEIRFRWPDRTVFRERRLASVSSKSGAHREAESREAFLREQGKSAVLAAKVPPPAQPVPARVPTLREFGPRWIEGHCLALRQKRAGVDAKRTILRTHLYPTLGDLPLNRITTERVTHLCAGLTKYSRKTLANILATLAKLLRTAVDWEVIAAMPCKIKIPKAARTPPTFYEIDAMRRLIDAAAGIDTRTHALVLLGLHGGLRRGEILGLDWADVNLSRRQLTVRRHQISRYVDTPKSGHGRILELSAELGAALARHRDAAPSTSGRVFLQDTGRPARTDHLYAWIDAAMARAGLPSRRGGRQAPRDAPLCVLGPRRDGRADDRDPSARRP